MAQYAYPDADTSVGNWAASTGSNRYAMIDDAYDVASGTADDTWISVSDDSMSTPEAITVSLSSVTDPSSATGHSVVVLWNDGSGMGSINLNVSLLDSDGGAVKNEDFNASSSPETSTMTLNATQANSISGYDNLRLVLTATDGGSTGTTTSVYRAYFTCPDAASSTPIAAISMNTYRQMRN